MDRLLKVVLITLVLSGVAAAQIPLGGSIFVGYAFSRGDVFAYNSAPGPSFLSPSVRTGNFNGWEASLEGKFLPFIGIVIDASQRYASENFNANCEAIISCTSPQGRVDSRVLSLAIGPKVSVSVGKFTPFAHALFGGAHITDSNGVSNSDTSIITELGGGLDYKIIKGLAWRLQGDELHTRFFGTGQDHVRLSTGLVLRF